MNTVIKVDNLSKKYIIGHQVKEPYQTLRDTVARKSREIGKRLLHPFLSSSAQSFSGTEEFWALKDVSFEVQQGDRLGIIGRNGAGKSTLLKVLSRITEPTKGRVHIKGRVASLLEVGTGFHPELTGRENIFLNGAILGMGKVEIKKKFDEIVAFAEVEKFLDTPVKHFSSGMYVRLAFAVAAHLEPEILVVDEVLAVGDAQFQNKCLGKMQEVGEEGRTVLFVSHNMSLILQLTNRVIMLESGRIYIDSTTEESTKEYLKIADNNEIAEKLETKDSDFLIEEFSFLSDKIEYGFNKPLKFKLNVSLKREKTDMYISIIFINSIGARLLTTKANIKKLRQGKHEIYLDVENHRLTPGNYYINFGISIKDDIVFIKDKIINLELLANCIDEPLLLPHLSKGKDKIGAFCPITINCIETRVE